MSRIKYFNPYTGKWEYADSSFVVGGDDSGGNADLTGVVKSVNGVTPDENGNVEIETTPDELEQLALLAELDMLPAVHDVTGEILTDKNGNVILRY